MDDETSSSEPPSPDDSPGREQAGRAPSPAGFDLLDPARLLTDAQHTRLCGAAVAALAHLGSPGEVRARVVSDAEMADAHERYSGVAGTTDVLTFDLSEAGALDTDLLVCVDEARRQADRRGHPVEHELTLYIIHGVLHCLGYDDKSDADSARMHAEEDRILTAIGLGPVYAAHAGARGDRP